MILFHSAHLSLGQGQPEELSCVKKLANGVWALKDKVMSLMHDKPVVILPAVSSSPETSLGVGFAAIYYIRPKGDTVSRPSYFENVFIYTLQNQFFFSNPYNIFLNKEKYWLNGEVGYYIYPYRYYGQGTNISTKNYEDYSTNYLRLELNALRRLAERFYVGPTIFYDHYSKVKIKQGGELDTKNVLGIQAKDLLGFGLSFRYDRRDNMFAPRQGYYLEGRALFYQDKIVGAYNFADLYIDARKYFYIDHQWETGFQLYHKSIIGQAPFYNLALLGNSHIMRGYYQGAYRDKHMTAVQAEVRHYLFDRFVFSAFGGLGSVSNTFMNYTTILGSYGVGLRYEINKKERIRIRVDYGRGFHSQGLYISLKEAF